MIEKFFIFLIASFIVFLFFAIKGERETWIEYAKENNCQYLNEKINGESNLGVGVSVNGNLVTTVTSTNNKYKYKCGEQVIWNEYDPRLIEDIKK